MNSNKFRKELIKIMPRYKWTVHRKLFPESNFIAATGIQTSGFNRLSNYRWQGGEKVTKLNMKQKAPVMGKTHLGYRNGKVKRLHVHYEDCKTITKKWL